MSDKPRTGLGRLYAGHKGDREIIDWNLPDGSRYTLDVRVRRGSTFGAPSISARMMDRDFNSLGTFAGRLDELKPWLRQWQLTL